MSSSSQWCDLVTLISEWNKCKFDLFEISEPNENGDFHGIMRFHFKEQQKTLSKCIRVDSRATSEDLILVLCEKLIRLRKELCFATDYCLYEVYSEKESKKLYAHDRPLWYQLNWARNKDRVGKFFLVKEPCRKIIDLPQKLNTFGKNRYEKITWLSEGTFGEAILVNDCMNQNEKKIIKKTKKQVTLDMVPEITKEAVIIASLQHPHLVAYYDCFYEDGYFYLVTEYCDGGDLRRRINEEKERNVHPKEAQVVKWAIQLTSALKYMHFEKNLIHKDVKPQNVFIKKVNDGNLEVVKLGDFGFANDADTASSFKAGTLNYMSPERICGKKSDKHTDIWSLGIVLYEYCSHERPNLVDILDDKIALTYYSDSFNAILKAILSIKSCKRPDSCELLEIFSDLESLNSINYDKNPRQILNAVTKCLKNQCFSSEKSLLITSDIEQVQKIENLQLLTPHSLPSQIPQTSSVSCNDLPGFVHYDTVHENGILECISKINHQQCSFKLAPVYTMYMMLRSRLENYQLILKIVQMIRECVAKCQTDLYQLTFWMANSSELLYLLKNDYQLKKHSHDAQERLAECVQMSFKYSVNLMQQALDGVLSAFIDPSDHVEDVHSQDTSVRPTFRSVTNILSDFLQRLRLSMVNNGLIIQVYSYIFHFISSWLFNRLISGRNVLCCKYWGEKLLKRLKIIQNWSEKNGLELAAECHLVKIQQSAFLLQAAKSTRDDFSSIIHQVFMLNSHQIKALVQNYSYEDDESEIDRVLIDNLVAIAQCYVDEPARSRGEVIKCEEDYALGKPILLPKDDYSSEVLQGIPIGLKKFISDIKWLNFYENTSDSCSASWFTHLGPKTLNIALNKCNGELGIKIVTQKNELNLVSGIQVLSLVPGGVAHEDGRLKVGDLLTKINNESLIGISHERAHEIMSRACECVTLTVTRDEPKCMCKFEEEASFNHTSTEEGYASFQTKSLEDFFRDASKISFITELS